MPDAVILRSVKSITNCERPISNDSGFSQNSSSSLFSTPLRKFRAEHDYTARRYDELSFKKGDKIYLDPSGKSEKEWYYGKLNGKQGRFPVGYTTELIRLWRFEKEDFEMMSEKDIQHLRIGFGATASVHKIKCAQSCLERVIGRFSQERVDECVALKKFKAGFGHKSDEPHDEQRAIKALKDEAVMIANFNHKNIVQFMGYSIDNPFFGLIFELCHGGSLRKLCTSTIDKTRSMPLKVLVNWAGQIASGMEYLTQLRYVHRDLKADNVLVKQIACQCDFNLVNQCSRCNGTALNYLHLKIADFGGTRKMASRSEMSTVAGTYAWLAPETFSRNSYTEYSDVWSYGVVLWEILYRVRPYQEIENQAAVAHSVSRDELKLEIYENCPEKLAGIMQKCWNIEPKRRPHFSEIVQYFNDYTEQLKRLNGEILIAPILRTKIKENFERRSTPGSSFRKFLNQYLSPKGTLEPTEPVSSQRQKPQLKNLPESLRGSMSSLVAIVIDKVSGTKP